MEYDEDNKPVQNDAAMIALANVTERLNEHSNRMAELAARLDALTATMDESTHMTSEEYGKQVVEQVMAAMPAIQQAAMKRTKGGRR